MSSPQTLRPATPHDDAFLRLLFAATNPTLSLLPEPVRTQLADMQYRGRQLTYAAHPDAQDLILCFPDATPVGRMLFAATPTGLHLIDIAVLPQHQGHGFATLALQHLQQLAGSREVTLQLTPGNPAERLYRHLGFHLTTQNETSLHMLWQPAFASNSLDTPDILELKGARPRGSSSPEPMGIRPSRRSISNPLLLRILSDKIGGEGWGVASALILLLGFAGFAHAQGILTVTPGRVISTSAGTGNVGYTGDGGAATSATLAAPSAVAYDASGNLYLADSLNHVIREISSTGTITTIAGTGVAGFGGDGNAATAAFLDTPTGVAVDASGNVYIADSHNNRIRKVTAGTITTIAGTGVAGFSGDNAAATAAQLALPSAIALDASGNVYIADRNNHRIRKITGTTISTIAGDGEELFAGDGGAATAAALDSPSGVAVDSTGNVYIADRNNLRIRVVNTAGTISTLAGSGTGGFTGSFSGDGSMATAAALAKPTGVSVDASGNVYIADTDNQRIREVSGSTIATIVGSGAQGFGSDSSTASGTNLNEPKAVAPDSVGNLSIGDRLNQRLRAAALPTLAFASQGVGVNSTPQPVTLANTGTASITVSAATFTGAFATTTSPCGPLPITLAAGGSCVENLVFNPAGVGPASGNVIFSGTGILPSKLLLTGGAVKSITSISLSSNAASPFSGQPVTFTAGVSVPGSVFATGNVVFLDGITPIGTAPLVNGVGVLTISALADGSHSITAMYTGDGNYIGSTSVLLPEFVLDFRFALSVNSTSPAILPGQTAVYNFTIQPLNGPFTVPITLSATGLPPGASVVFNPQTLTLGASPSSFTMTVQTQVAKLHRREFFGGTTVALGLFLLLPFSRRRHRSMRRLPVSLGIMAILSLSAVAGLTGCGSDTGFLGEVTKSYTITVTATATNAGATLQHTATTTLTVQ